MTKSFNCASCSAPLEFEGKTMQKCKFCGSTVIAPPEMFYASSAGDFSSLTGKALKIAEIDRLIHNGNKIEAIKVFRETFGVGLKEAKDAVEAMERGQSVDISGMQIRPGPQQIKLSAEDLDKVKKVGMTVGGVFLVIFVGIALVVVAGVVVGLIFGLGAINSKFANTNTASATPVPKPTNIPDTTELLKIGGQGNGGGKFKDNRHVAVDGRGRIYSSDYSPFRIQVFDPEGKFLNQWAAEKGTNLYDLAADREGNLYLACDKGLFKYKGETGELLQKVESIHTRGIALTWDNKILAAQGKTLTIFDNSLKPIQEIKDWAERASSTFGFDKIAVDGSGMLYTIDKHTGDLCKFSSDGKFLNRFPAGLGGSNSIAIDPKGRIFVSNTGSVAVFDDNGRRIKEFEAAQAFGMAFNQEGDLFITSRPWVIKKRLNF